MPGGDAIAGVADSGRAVAARRGGASAYAMWGLGMAGYVFAATCRSSMSATGVVAAQHFGTTSTALSAFVYLQLFVYAAMQIPAGVLLDRFGPRALIAGGCVLMATGQALLAVAPAIWMAVAGRAIVGSGDALVFISVIRLLAAWFPLRRLPLMNQLTGQIGNCGQIVSVYPFVWVMDAGGWSLAFLSLTGTGILIAFCVAFAMRDRPAESHGGSDSAASRRTPSMADVADGLRRALHVPGTYCGFWVHAMTWFSINMLNQLWGFPFLLAVEGYSKAQASAYLAVGMLLCVAWAILFGRVAGIHPVHGRAVVVYSTVISQMLLWTVLLLTPGPHPAWFMAVLLLALSSGTPAASIAFDYVRDSNDARNLGAATGLANIGGFLFTGIALLAVGVALDAQGATSPGLYSSSVMRAAMTIQYPLWILGLFGFAVTLPGTVAGIRRRFASISLAASSPAVASVTSDARPEDVGFLASRTSASSRSPAFALTDSSARVSPSPETARSSSPQEKHKGKVTI